MSNIEDVLSTIPRYIFYLNHHYIHLRHRTLCHRSILSVKIRVVAFLRSGGLRADGSTDRRAIKEPQLTLQYNAKPYDLSLQTIAEPQLAQQCDTSLQHKPVIILINADF